MTNATHLEPAERDPKAIRRTVIFLIIVILVGGAVIAWKYRQKLAEEAEEYAKGRPAMSEGSVARSKNFQMLGHDGEVHDMTLLEGKLTLMVAISVNRPEQSKKLIDVMKATDEKFSESGKVQFLCLSADHPDEVSVEKLAEFAKSNGVTGDNWYFLTAHDEGYIGYVKDTLNLGIIRDKDTKVSRKELPDLMKIVDPALVIRGQKDDFTFLQYHEFQQKAEKDVKTNPEILEEENFEEWFLNSVSFHTNRMHKNMNYVLEHEEFDLAKIKEGNRSNKYSTPLMIFGGFILFIIILGIKVKRQRAA